VVALTPSLDVERVLAESKDLSLDIAVAGTHVAIVEPSAAFSIIDAVSGDVLARGTKPFTHQRASMDSMGSRALSMNSISEAALLDVQRGPMPWTVKPSGYAVRIAVSVEDAIQITGTKQNWVVDPTNGTSLGEVSLTDNGKKIVESSDAGFYALRDRATGALTKLPDLPNTTWLSPGGSVQAKMEVDYTTRLGSSFLHVKTKDHDWTRRPYNAPIIEMSPNDDLVVVVDDFKVRKGVSCDGPCIGARVLNAATGSTLASIMPDEAPLSYDPRLAFSPDGAHLFVGWAMFAPRTGKREWSVPDDAKFLGFVRGQPFAFIAQRSAGSIVDVATGKEVSHCGPADALVGSSDNGKYLLLSRNRSIVLVETSTGAEKSLPLPAPDDAKRFVAHVSNDGAFVWSADGLYLVAYRVADGRMLRWTDVAGAVSDEGVFDPANAKDLPYVVRLGPNVEKSPMGTLADAADKLGHPNLVADFIAGRSISPAK